MAEHIRIGDVTPRIQYTGDGAQVLFTYPFPIFAAADMEVYLDQTKQTGGFAVDGAGDSAGGDVTFDAAPAAGVLVTLRRRLAVQRTSDFQESGEFRSKVINDELDYLTAALQQVSDDGERALRLGATDPTATLTLPDKAARANLFLAFDADGGAIASDASGPPGPEGPAGNMDGANNLSEIADAVQARANLGLGPAAVENVAAGGSGGLLRADGDGSALTAIDAADHVARANIILNAFRIAVQGGLSVQNMVDGVVDEFEDETGVDTGSSTNELYNSADKLYGSAALTTTAGTTTYDSAGFTLVDRTFQVLNGVVISSVGVRKATSGTVKVKVMLQNTTTDIDVAYEESFSHAGGGWQDFTLTTPYGVPASGTYRIGVYSTGAPGNVAAGTIVRSFFSGDSTNSSVFTADSSAAYATRYTALALDMTLISSPSTALAQPDEAFIAVWQQDVDAITLNTDLKAYASRDGGTTWTQFGLTEEVSLGGSGRILTGTADISTQPAGTSMTWKLETLNAKSMNIHGVGLEWS